MGFNIRGGDKSSLALLSSKRGRAYARTRADEAFALPNFADAAPSSTIEPQHQLNNTARPEATVEHGAENVKQTMLQHESVFKEQLHELHRLYKKQCKLMADSCKDPASGRMPEPPSSNSSFLCDSETGRLHVERSFENANYAMGFASNQSNCVLLGKMDDEKNSEDSGSSSKPSSHSLSIEACGPSKKQSRHQMFDLKQFPLTRPIIDLERPADEYMDVEVQEEKPQIAGLINKSEDALVSGHNHFVRSNKAGEKRELASRASRGLWDTERLGFQANNNDNVPEGPVGSKEEMLKGSLQHKECAINHSTYSDVHPFPVQTISTPMCLKEEPFFNSKEALSASRLPPGLPDLNGDVEVTEQQFSPSQVLLQRNAKEGQCVDVEVDTRSCSSTSKLPHWLCQAPSARPSPLHVSAHGSVSNPRASVFIPQVHDKTPKPSMFIRQYHDKTKWRSNLPMEMGKASSLYIQEPNLPMEMGKASSLYIQEPNCSWARSGMINFEQCAGFHGDRPSSSFSQPFQGANAPIAEGSYSGVHGRECISGGVPFYFSQATDSERMATMTAISMDLSPHVVGLESETRRPSAERLSRVIPEVPMNFSAMSPWYQQRESFSSLLQQASNPEPFCKRSISSTSGSRWEIASTHQSLPHGMDFQERGMFGLDTHVKNTEASSSQPKSTIESPAFDGMHAGSVLDWTIPSMKGNELPSCKRVEKAVLMGQASKVSSSRDHQSDPSPRKILFDLNLSSEDCMPEANFEACVVNQRQILKQESETSRSSGWVTLSAMTAPLMYEPQNESGLQATGFGDNVAADKGTVSEVPFDANMTRSHYEASYLTKALDNLYSERDKLMDDTCADYCSGEDETGGGFVGVKSSDGSGLTSCESLDRVHLELIKARDDSNTSSAEACHSFESRIPNHTEDVVFFSSLQRKRSLGLPSEGNGDFKLFKFSNVETLPSHNDAKRDFSPYNCTEFADESEVANEVAKIDLVEASEAADLLLSLGSDLASTVENDDANDGFRKGLDWLADIIPHEDYRRPEELNVEVGKYAAAEDALEVSTEKNLDAFELAVLALEPVDPNFECRVMQPLDRGKVVENTPTLRRRPSRRGRAGKDFKKEMLRSMGALSRHEVTEDFQVIEGLIKSAAETTISCSPSPNDDKPLSSPEQFSIKSFGKGRSSKFCRGSRLTGLLNVCSWGESTRRKRMGRQRSQWLSLPPGVRTCLFPNAAANLASLA